MLLRLEQKGFIMFTVHSYVLVDWGVRSKRVGEVVKATKWTVTIAFDDVYGKEKTKFKPSTKCDTDWTDESGDDCMIGEHPYTKRQIDATKRYLDTHDVIGFDRTVCKATFNDAVELIDAAELGPDATEADVNKALEVLPDWSW